MTTAPATTPQNDHGDFSTKPYLPLTVIAVLCLVEAGHNQHRIARELQITPGAVEARRAHARRVFRTPFADHAARQARQLGLLPED